MSSVQQIVEDAINSHKVAIFTKSYCPHCHAAKDLLNALGIEYFNVELDTRPDGQEIQDYLLEKSGQRTVPNIYINQKHVGGNSDLQTANQNGTLKQLLA
ncbi:glutaredoxin-1 [Backusella circina FSU 941]|nr:glutaredoxin-1 [Backusella circina FSU 941]